MSTSETAGRPLSEFFLESVSVSQNPIFWCEAARMMRVILSMKSKPRPDAEISLDEALAGLLEQSVTEAFLRDRAERGCGDEKLLELISGIPETSQSVRAAGAFARVKRLATYSVGEIRVRGYRAPSAGAVDPLAEIAA